MGRTALRKSLAPPPPAPQRVKDNAEQVANHAGGYVYKVSDWDRLDRFLVLGTDGGTFYQSERDITKQNTDLIKSLARMDGSRVALRALEMLRRAPKPDPCLYALACVASFGSDAAKATVRMHITDACKTGTHLFHFVEYCNALRGWGNSLKRTVARWYRDLPVNDLAYQIIKYQQRDGWSHANLLQLAHPRNNRAYQTNTPKDAIAHWILHGTFERTGGFDDHTLASPAILRIQAFDEAKTASRARVIKLIRDYDLPRECVPTEMLNHADVWAALFDKMPYWAMLRNLNKMTSVGLLADLGATTNEAARRIVDPKRVRNSGIHPIAILTSLRQYAKGRGDKGSLSWKPVGQIVSALDDAFMLAFSNVEKTSKRFYLGVDISGSMSSGTVGGTPLTPREAAAVMAMATLRSEDRTIIKGYTSNGGNSWSLQRNWGITDIPINAKTSLQDVCHVMERMPMGGTDCALPILDAIKNKIPVDCFVNYTDNETWTGDVKVEDALRQYRQKMGIDARLVAVAFTATRYSIGDPNDKGTLNLAGFDSSCPALISGFAKGDF